jgi:hypothetical protein
MWRVTIGENVVNELPPNPNAHEQPPIVAEAPHVNDPSDGEEPLEQFDLPEEEVDFGREHPEPENPVSEEINPMMQQFLEF